MNPSSMTVYIYVNISKVVTLCPVIRILEKFHLPHIFKYHFYVGGSQFCTSIPVQRPEDQDQISKEMRTVTHICPSPPETVIKTKLLLFSNYSFDFPSTYSAYCTPHLSMTHSSPLFHIHHLSLSAANFPS